MGDHAVVPERLIILSKKMQKAGGFEELPDILCVLRKIAEISIIRNLAHGIC